MEVPAVRPTVLVVDDAPENLMIMQAILANDYSLKLFNDANDALDYAFANPPDLILLDVMMPGIDGFESCRRLKANPKLSDVPVIFITAKNDVKNEALGFSVGASDFIHKPISAPVLSARVKTHLKIKFMLDAQKTKRMQAEVALDELSQLHQSIIAETDSGVMVFKEDGECILANEAAATIVGGALEEIQQDNFKKIQSWRDAGMLKAAEVALRTGITQKINAPMRTSYGKDIWCVASLGRIDRRNSPPCLLVVFSDMSAYKEAEQKIINISEETQQRIGQELHDDLGQHLTGIAFMSEVLFQRLKSQGNADVGEAQKITSLINEAISKTRKLAQGLYPVELKEAGLRGMLEHLASNVGSIHQIKCEVICTEECQINDSIAVINLFRISQEAVNNAIRHGGATKITLKIISTPTITTLEIIDNGCGIDDLVEGDAKGGLGMHTMRYRASLLGATLRMVALPDGGTNVAISLSTQ